MERSEKIALIGGGGISLMIVFLVMSSTQLEAACSDWSNHLYEKSNALNHQHEVLMITHPNFNGQEWNSATNDWMDYQRELYTYGGLCYVFGARIV